MYNVYIFFIFLEIILSVGSSAYAGVCQKDMSGVTIIDCHDKGTVMDCKSCDADCNVVPDDNEDPGLCLKCENGKIVTDNQNYPNGNTNTNGFFDGICNVVLGHNNWSAEPNNSCPLSTDCYRCEKVKIMKVHWGAPNYTWKRIYKKTKKGHVSCP